MRSHLRCLPYKLLRKSNISLKDARNRTTGFCFVRDFAEFRFVDPGDLAGQIEVNLGDRPVSIDLFKRDRRFGRKFVRCNAFGAHHCRGSHRKTACMRCGNEFLRIRADAVLEAGSKRVLRLIQYATLCGDCTFALFEVAMPNGACGAFHSLGCVRKRYSWGGHLLKCLEAQNAVRMLTIKSFESHRASKDCRDNGPAAALKHLLKRFRARGGVKI